MSGPLTEECWVEGEVVPASTEGEVVPASEREPKLLKGYGDIFWLDQARPTVPIRLTEEGRIFTRGIYVKGHGTFIASTRRPEEEEDDE